MLKFPFPNLNKPTNNDRWAHELVFPLRKRGYFVELGASDGVRGSSCWLLNRIGWSGICVEPSLSFYDDLIRNRPEAICRNVCVADRTGTAIFHEKQFMSRVKYGEIEPTEPTDRIAPCITLYDLLREAKAPRLIDYLAMDIQGSEYPTLSVFPFSEYEFLAISTEADKSRSVLLDSGYVKVQNPFNSQAPWEQYYLHPCMVDSYRVRVSQLNR